MNTPSEGLAAALLDLLATSGRAMTITEIRTRLTDYNLGELPTEPIYRNLATLRRRGKVRRVRHEGQRRSYWAVHASPALQLEPAWAM